MRTAGKFLAALLLVFSVLFAAVMPALAATNANTGALCPTDEAGAGTNFNILCTNTWTPEKVITTGINILLFVAFVGALGFLIIGGIRWIASGGDKEGTAKAKGTVTSALIGLVIVLGAWVLLNVVVKIFGLGDISKLKLPSLPGTQQTIYTPGPGFPIGHSCTSSSECSSSYCSPSGVCD